MSMDSTGVAQLKARFSEYLARVRPGEQIGIIEQGRPMTRPVPAPGLDGEDAEKRRLLALARGGMVQVGSMALRETFWPMERPRDPYADVRAALEAERREGR
jgi:antitoxin (DNA-binding transcriptional repressor) of toxin-antitoxin stability system